MPRVDRIGDAAELMLDHVENKTTFIGETTLGVAGRSHTDADQWRTEIDRVFKRAPLMLAFTAELPNPGDYKAMDAIGMPVLINRDKAGKVRAFLNVCSHRGAPVAGEGCGNCARRLEPATYQEVRIRQFHQTLDTYIHGQAGASA